MVLLGDLEERVEVSPECRGRGRDVAVGVNAGRSIVAVATDPNAAGIDVALPQLAEVCPPPGGVELVAKLVPAFPGVFAPEIQMRLPSTWNWLPLTVMRCAEARLAAKMKSRKNVKVFIVTAWPVA